MSDPASFKAGSPHFNGFYLELGSWERASRAQSFCRLVHLALEMAGLLRISQPGQVDASAL